MGGGGKSSTSTTSSPYAQALWAAGNKWNKAAFPLYSQALGQASQAIQTGGVNSQIPSINRAVDASRGASSQAEQQTRQSLARLNLTNTPFAQEILGQNRETSANRIADIGPTMASQIAAGAPNLISLGQRGLGAMGQAAGLDTTTQYTPSGLDQFAQMATIGLGTPLLAQGSSAPPSSGGSSPMSSLPFFSMFGGGAGASGAADAGFGMAGSAGDYTGLASLAGLGLV